MGEVSKPRFDAVKFKELILYVSSKCANMHYFGAVKLNKVLFFSDFMAYGLHGKPITGAAYIRLEKGPAPKALVPIRNEMVEHGDAVIVPVRVFNRTQQRLVPKREPNVSIFSPDELKLVDDVIEALCNTTADQTSELSHERSAGWKLVEDREEIPYESVFLSTEPLTRSDIESGKALAEKYGWSSQGNSAM
jgi:hypothetical protein